MNAFLLAPSVGGFYSANIKGRYDYRNGEFQNRGTRMENRLPSGWALAMFTFAISMSSMSAICFAETLSEFQRFYRGELQPLGQLTQFDSFIVRIAEARISSCDNMDILKDSLQSFRSDITLAKRGETFSSEGVGIKPTASDIRWMEEEFSKWDQRIQSHLKEYC